MPAITWGRIQVEPYNPRVLPKNIIAAHTKLVKAVQKVSKINMTLTRLNFKHTEQVSRYTTKVQEGK